MSGSVFADGLSKTSVNKAYQAARSIPSRGLVVNHQMEPLFAKRILEGRPPVENPVPTDDTGYDEITLVSLTSGLSYECDIVKKLVMVVLFLHTLLAVWYITWT